MLLTTVQDPHGKTRLGLWKRRGHWAWRRVIWIGPYRLITNIQGLLLLTVSNLIIISILLHVTALLMWMCGEQAGPLKTKGQRKTQNSRAGRGTWINKGIKWWASQRKNGSWKEVRGRQKRVGAGWSMGDGLCTSHRQCRNHSRIVLFTLFLQTLGLVTAAIVHLLSHKVSHQL